MGMAIFGLSCCKTSRAVSGGMVKVPPMGIMATSTLPKALICSGVSLWLRSPRCTMQTGPEIENEGGALEGVAELLLINRNGVDQEVADRGADFVPPCAVVGQAAQNDRIAPGELDGVMVGMFSADGDGVGCDYRGRRHTG